MVDDGATAYPTGSIEAEQTVNGLADLERALDNFSIKVEKKIARLAMKRGAQIILDRARATVPVRTGALRDSLNLSFTGRGGKPTWIIRSGKRGARLAYAWAVESGAVPHLEMGRGGGFLAFLGLFRRVVLHPGARPQPFLESALITSREVAVTTTQNALHDLIELENYRNAS